MNLWILTEERQKINTFKLSLAIFAKDKNAPMTAGIIFISKLIMLYN